MRGTIYTEWRASRIHTHAQRSLINLFFPELPSRMSYVPYSAEAWWNSPAMRRRVRSPPDCHPSLPGLTRWRARGACSHPACEHHGIRAARDGRSQYETTRSPYVEQSFARVVSPSPSYYQESTQRGEAVPPGRSIPSYLDFRPWGIFSTGTHAAACNFVTPPIEALVSTSYRPMCTRTIMYRVYREVIHENCDSEIHDEC